MEDGQQGLWVWVILPGTGIPPAGRQMSRGEGRGEQIAAGPGAPHSLSNLLTLKRALITAGTWPMMCVSKGIFQKGILKGPRAKRQ